MLPLLLCRRRGSNKPVQFRGFVLRARWLKLIGGVLPLLLLLLQHRWRQVRIVLYAPILGQTPHTRARSLCSAYSECLRVRM